MASKKRSQSRKKDRQNPRACTVLTVLGIGAALAAVGAVLLIVHFAKKAPEEPTEGQIDLADYIDAQNLADASVDLSEIDEAYADLLTEIRLSYAEYTQTDSADIPAEQFDRVSFSYSGVPVDMEAGDDLLAALTGETSTVIGSESLYPAYTDPQNPDLSTKSFEEQLIGAQLGQSLSVLVTYPENGSAVGVDVTPLCGRQIRFTLTITALEKAELPEISDSLISRYTGGDFTSLEAFRQDAYATIKAEYAYLALYGSVSVVSCPKEPVDAETVRYIQSIILTEYDLSTLTDAQIEEIYDELHDEAVEYAYAAVTDRMIKDYLCDIAEITLSDDEYAAALADDFSENFIAYSYIGIDSEAELEERYGRENLRSSYRVEKLMDKVADLVEFR